MLKRRTEKVLISLRYLDIVGIRFFDDWVCNIEISPKSIVTWRLHGWCSQSSLPRSSFLHEASTSCRTNGDAEIQSGDSRSGFL